jgi:hypothetical protein
VPSDFTFLRVNEMLKQILNNTNLYSLCIFQRGHKQNEYLIHKSNAIFGVGILPGGTKISSYPICTRKILVAKPIHHIYGTLEIQFTNLIRKLSCLI